MIRRRALFRAHSGARFSDKLSTSWFLVPKLSTTATWSQGLYTLSCKWKVRTATSGLNRLTYPKDAKVHGTQYLSLKITLQQRVGGGSKVEASRDLYLSLTFIIVTLAASNAMVVGMLCSLFCWAGMICARAKLTD